MAPKKQTPGTDNKKSISAASPAAVQTRGPLAPILQPAALIGRAEAQAGLLGASDVLQLQRALGNRTICRLLARPGQRPVLQPRLTVGPARDSHEQEADRVASQVVSQLDAPSHPTGGSLRRQEEEDHKVQKMPVAPSRPGVQRREDGRRPESILPDALAGGDVTPRVESAIQEARGGGRRLEDGVRQPMEQAFGADFGSVRVHTDGRSDRLNRAIQAEAFTTGQDLFFRRGAYAPGSRDGQALLAHELTHVVQQNGAQVRRAERAQTLADRLPPAQRSIASGRLLGQISPVARRSQPGRIHRCFNSRPQPDAPTTLQQVIDGLDEDQLNNDLDEIEELLGYRPTLRNYKAVLVDLDPNNIELAVQDQAWVDRLQSAGPLIGNYLDNAVNFNACFDGANRLVSVMGTEAQAVRFESGGGARDEYPLAEQGQRAATLIGHLQQASRSRTPVIFRVHLGGHGFTLTVKRDRVYQLETLAGSEDVGTLLASIERANSYPVAEVIQNFRDMTSNSVDRRTQAADAMGWNAGPIGILSPPDYDDVADPMTVYWTASNLASQDVITRRFAAKIQANRRAMLQELRRLNPEQV